MWKIICKNISKNLSSKYSQKHIDHTKQSATDEDKTTSKRAIQKIAEATGILIGNKIAEKIRKDLYRRIIQLQTKEIYLEKDIDVDLRLM